MSSISRRAQLYFHKLLYMALFGFVGGALLWMSFVKLVELPENKGKAFIVVQSPKVSDEVVFHYPDVSGVLRLSTVRQNENGSLEVQVGEDFVALDENLLVGVVKFRF